jgi:tetraacyldisaccharide 4'-kinase
MRVDWNEILSGERRGAGPTILRGLLALGVPVYAAAVELRSRAYARGLRTIQHAPVPVVSIGNLTTGGTGKTPLVAWAVDQLQRAGATPGILSRGYRSLDGQANDEKLLLDQLCPGTPHIQNRDRVAGASIAVTQHGCDVLVLDDGFQHRRLARDLDVVLIDALNPWGFGSLLPRGLLREPRRALARADVVCLTRVDQLDADALAALRAEVRGGTDADLAEVAFVPLGLVNASGARAPLSKLQTATCAACCGIGNPQAFRRTLTALGVTPTADRLRAYPDHYHYSAVDRAELAEWLRSVRADLLVVTRKDLVKLPVNQIGPAELWALDVGPEFTAGEESLRRRLQALIPPGSD